ncbi:MAG: Gfo/Idh/MocA family oxidoreductase [Bacteroidota bacterium]
MKQTFNWGIIGIGKIANKFAQDLRVTPNARLLAVASRSLDRAQQFAQQYDAEFSYGSYKEILNTPNLHAIYIATPHVSHCENTLMCLEHQIPVLCEKPFAMNANEVGRMISLARFQQTFLMEALWTRFLPTTHKVLELIEEGAIGELISVKADFGFKATFDPESRLFNPGLGGGSLLDVGIYPVFLALLLLGKPEGIKAVASIGPSRVDENCGIILQYTNNKMAMLHSSIIAQTPTEALICGSLGNIRINSRWHEPTSLTLLKEGEEPRDFFFDYNSNGYRYEIEEVMRCVRDGQQESDQLPLDFSMDLMNLLDQIRMKAGIYYPHHDALSKTIRVEGGTRFSMN